jgi:hypothetical protein
LRLLEAQSVNCKYKHEICTCSSHGIKATLISFNVFVYLATGCLHNSLNKVSGHAVGNHQKNKSSWVIINDVPSQLALKTHTNFGCAVSLATLDKLVDRFTLPPEAPPIGDTSLTHVMRLAAHSTPTAMGQSFMMIL